MHACTPGRGDSAHRWSYDGRGQNGTLNAACDYAFPSPLASMYGLEDGDGDKDEDEGEEESPTHAS
eukprot:166417-Prymnesium_polylepis.1